MDRKQLEGTRLRPKAIYSRMRKLAACVLFCLCAILGQDYYGLRGANKRSRGRAADSIRNLITPSKNFVVWMYPFSPPSAYSLGNIQEDEVLICPYQDACHGGGEALNLVKLTNGSFFHPYITEHIYQKLRHFKDFAHHVQAITMLSLLRSEEGVCVKTLGGGTTKFCNPFLHQDYNPYTDSSLIDRGESDLGVTNFPFQFLEKDGHPLALAPDMDTEQFATYGFYYNHEFVYPVGHYNSGEDIQSMAGVGWYPFLSSVRNKNSALVNYTGYFIANMLASGENLMLPDAEAERKDSMQKTDLLSIFIASKESIKQKSKYLREYTDRVYPFGCRSTLTCQWMKEYKIKSYFSACFTLTSNYEGSLLKGEDASARRNALQIVNPSPTNFSVDIGSFWHQDLTAGLLQKARQEKTLILFVDCTDMSVIPDSVKNSGNVRFLSADIPGNYPINPRPHLERIKYCYRLLSQYKNYAKVIITSRIHVGLPAAALGTPVIFVSKNGWLPGGKEKTGRVAGLLDVFHRVDKERGLDWTFGDLSGPMPPNPGSHYADRFRASFWHRLARHTYYADAARLFGIIPLQRMGVDMIRSDIQHKFQFLLEVGELNDWQPRRAIENVFYFHPNAEVHVHVHMNATQDSDILKDAFAIFIESGYDMHIHEFTPKLHLNRVKGVVVDQTSHDHALQVGSLLWNYGGVFLSKSTFLTGELTLDLNEGYTLNDDGSVVFMIGEKGSARLLKSLSGSNKNGSALQENGKAWKSTVLGSNQTTSCMEEKSWTYERERDIAVTIDSKSLYERAIRIDTACYSLVEQNCIYCNELHWEF